MSGFKPPALFGPAPTLEELRARYGEQRYKWIALAVVVVGTVAAVMTSSIVNVALPDLMHAFGIGAERAQWVSSAHMAAMTVAMLLLPWGLARFGFRRVYFVSMGMLLVGSIGAGLVDDLIALIVMRVVQGTAAGLLQPLSTVLIMRAFPPEMRGRAMGLFGFGVVLAPAIGPSVGGVLVDAFGWRSVFFISVPIAAVGWLLAARLLPRMPASGAPRDFDIVGFAGVTAFVVVLLESFVRLHDHGLWSAQGAAWLGGAALLLVLTVWWERHHRAPLIDLSVFDNESFRVGIVVALIYGMGLFGSTLMVPAFVQTGLLYSATMAGTLLMPAGLALAVTMPVAGRLADRFEPRVLVMLGLGLFSLSFLLVAIWPEIGFWPLASMLILGRVGLGVILPSLSLATVQQVGTERVASASSVFNFVRLLGGSIGTSTLLIFVEWRARAGVVPPGTEPGHGQMIEAYRAGFVLLMLSFALAAACAWFLRGHSAGKPGPADPTANPPGGSSGEASSEGPSGTPADASVGASVGASAPASAPGAGAVKDR